MTKTTQFTIFALFFYLMTPFAAAAGYYLDIEETDDDKDNWGYEIFIGNPEGENTSFYVDTDRFAIEHAFEMQLERDQTGEPIAVYLTYPNKVGKKIDLLTATDESIYTSLYYALEEAEAIHSFESYYKALGVANFYQPSLSICDQQRLAPVIPFLEMLLATTEQGTVTSFFETINELAAYNDQCGLIALNRR